MKVIIAGGRRFKPTKVDSAILNRLYKKYKFTEVVSGKAKGADKFGEIWAKKNNIHVEPFPADWNDMSKPFVIKYHPNKKAYNALAGNKRNKKMAEYADAVILFPGGSGTNDMRKLSKQHNLKILYDAKK